MKYSLFNKSGVGIIADPTPVFCDIKNTFYLLFDLPHNGVYVAIFSDENCIEHRSTINNGECRVPKELLKKEHTLGLTVCEIVGDEIKQVWECYPLKISIFSSMRNSMRQITAGVDDRALYERLAQIESVHNASIEAFNSQKEKTDTFVEAFKSMIEKQEAVCAELIKQNQQLKNGYNQAIAVINDLEKRLHSLEKNYDPTII